MNPSPDCAAAPAGTSFSSLPLPPAALANLQQLGYTTMTPIQAASLPLALAGHDLIAQARTGSGKTAAFGLALLARLNPRRSVGPRSPQTATALQAASGLASPDSSRGEAQSAGTAPRPRSAPQGGSHCAWGGPAHSGFAVQALVLCPTRELAEQVAQELRRLARAEDHVKVLTLCGGSPVQPQLASLAHGAHRRKNASARRQDFQVALALLLEFEFAETFTCIERVGVRIHESREQHASLGVDHPLASSREQMWTQLHNLPPVDAQTTLKRRRLRLDSDDAGVREQKGHWGRRWNPAKKCRNRSAATLAVWPS